MVEGQPCCMCIKDIAFDLNGSESDAAGIVYVKALGSPGSIPTGSGESV